MNPALNLIMNLMSLTIYWLGAKLISAGHIDYAAVTTFSNYSMHVIMSFMFITLMFVMIPRGMVSLRRLNEILNTDIIDEVLTVSGDEAYFASRLLAKSEGVLVGISSGAALHIAIEKAKKEEGKTIVVLLPDLGDRYLSTDLF
jgi:ABC-type multidrug transport system fused ATPase/permease subunit